MNRKLKIRIKFFVLTLSLLVNFSGHLMAAEESRRTFDDESVKQSLVLQPIDNQQNGAVDHLFLLPDETLCCIASHLSMKELLLFKQVSQKARDIADLEILYTNYLDSDNPHKQDISSLFDKVIFTPQPSAIRLKRFAKAENGSIEVRFRDSQHLRDIVEQTPYIDGDFKGKVYFVRDEKVRDGRELVPLSGQLKQGFFVHVVADEPITLKGELNLPCRLFLPFKSNLNELKFNVRGSIDTKIESYCNAYDLATMLDTFDKELFKTCTSNAYNLFKHRINDPVPGPLKFSPLLKFSDNILIMSDSSLKILEKKYVAANKPLMYKAKSIAALEKIREELPEFSKSIGYVDPLYRQPAGVYCLDPLLFLVSGFEIHTDTHLIIAGKIDIPDHNLFICVGKGLWTFGLTCVARSSIYLLKDSIGIYIDLNIKPENMPEELWQKLLTKIQQL